jgi:hypothetical protein
MHDWGAREGHHFVPSIQRAEQEGGKLCWSLVVSIQKGRVGEAKRGQLMVQRVAAQIHNGDAERKLEHHRASKEHTVRRGRPRNMPSELTKNATNEHMRANGLRGESTDDALWMTRIPGFPRFRFDPSAVSKGLSFLSLLIIDAIQCTKGPAAQVVSVSTQRNFNFASQ